MATDKILELIEKEKILGQIYKITNIITKKCYIGQTLSHRLNKRKYRPFGYIGRFNDHISEAINNTKKKQCTYLNNSIRKHGKEKFKIELLKCCNKIELDDTEKFFIELNNSIYPNGYNLTIGGKTAEHKNVKNNKELQPFKKRGREFGYKHKESTKIAINKYCHEKKIERLSKYNLDDITQCIKPIRNKNTGEIHNYVIRINGTQVSAPSNNESLDEKYNYLKNILKEAIKSRGKNC